MTEKGCFPAATRKLGAGRREEERTEKGREREGERGKGERNEKGAGSQ